MTGDSARDRIVEAADRLFYEKGFERASFSDIAAEVGLSRGNFYHHFKTKDAILDAVIDRRAARTEAMLAAWAAASPRPEDRVGAYIDILIRNQAQILRHGCPVGGLCAELAKLDHAAQAAAARIFTLFREWLREAFARLGAAEPDAAAMDVLAWSQGVATMANALGDKEFLLREAARKRAWLAASAAQNKGDG